MEKLEFESENLYYTTIEREITNYYNLGYSNSSNFMELEIGQYSSLLITATKGSIIFSAVVGQNKEGKYIVSIYPNEIKRIKIK